MSILLTEGRYSQPRRLLELGFPFKFPKLKEALDDIFSNNTGEK
jgi:NAD dependent epimerase/dehydratase family enzyme